LASKRSAKLLKSKGGILLDLGCGARKQSEYWVGMDKRPLPNVDIVHDLEVLPYPFDDNSVLTCVASHVLEHLKPWLTIDIFNEVWRIMKVDGQFVIGVPYGTGHGFVQDPTHCNPFNESTFYYFDPYPTAFGWNEEKKIEGQFNVLYDIYKPKPWKIQDCYWESNGNLSAVLRKRG
jgi:SAM-dependent methyltransferase